MKKNSTHFVQVTVHHFIAVLSSRFLHGKQMPGNGRMQRVAALLECQIRWQFYRIQNYLIRAHLLISKRTKRVVFEDRCKWWWRWVDAFSKLFSCRFRLFLLRLFQWSVWRWTFIWIRTRCRRFKWQMSRIVILAALSWCARSMIATLKTRRTSADCVQWVVLGKSTFIIENCSRWVVIVVVIQHIMPIDLTVGQRWWSICRRWQSLVNVLRWKALLRHRWWAKCTPQMLNITYESWIVDASIHPAMHARHKFFRSPRQRNDDRRIGRCRLICMSRIVSAVVIVARDANVIRFHMVWKWFIRARRPSEPQEVRVTRERDDCVDHVDDRLADLNCLVRKIRIMSRKNTQHATSQLTHGSSRPTIRKINIGPDIIQIEPSTPNGK